jgi:hypothetical protein
MLSDNLSLTGNALDTVANEGARVGANRAFHWALVVIDEQARWSEIGHLLLHHIELDRS